VLFTQKYKQSGNLDNVTIMHNDDNHNIIINDNTEHVCYCENSVVAETCLKYLLKEIIKAQIYTEIALIHYQHLIVTKNGSI
jgi:uncharacterized protein (DUF427 family)